MYRSGPEDLHAHVREIVARQENVIARWQLVRAGWGRHAVDHHARRRGWVRIHDGVYAVAPGPLGQRQRWVAVVLSSPGTFLATWGAGACWGFLEWHGRLETVVRAGSGGPRRSGSLMVSHSRTLDGQTTRRDGLPIVTAARTLIDLAPHLGAKRLGRALRDSARLKLHSVDELAMVLRGHRGYRGIALLVELCDRYATIPYHRLLRLAPSRN